MKGPFSYLPRLVSKPTSSLSPASIWVVVFQAFIWWFIQSCSLSSLFAQNSYLLSITLKAFTCEKPFWAKSAPVLKLLQKAFCETVCQVFSDQEQVCQFQLWFIFMHLYCDCCTWLQAKLYNGELLSSMSCAMVSVMLLVRILLSTLHSINLWTCLLSSVFAWGQAKV